MEEPEDELVKPPAVRRHPGRGAGLNTSNRFTELSVELDPSELTEVDLRERTTYFEDRSRSVISTNNSPDIGFDASINPYRGCEHGCSYCYARPTHEYLGLSAGLDFERKIFVKRDAAALLRERLESRGWQPRTLMLSGVTDPYQPVERRLRISRSLLEVLARYRNPASVITKNALVTRDIDLLGSMAAWNGISVTLSITTLDEGLRARLEPRTSTIANRLSAIRQLSSVGVPVGVNMAPIIPGLTDHEIADVLEAAADAGASHANFTIVRLPHAVAELFEEWLEANVPLRKTRILKRIKEAHNGRLSGLEFGKRLKGEGVHAGQIGKLFRLTRKRVGIPATKITLDTDAFWRPGEARQDTLFEV